MCVCVYACVRGCVSCSVYLCLCVSLLHCSTTLMQIADGFVQVAVVVCMYTLYSLRMGMKGILLKGAKYTIDRYNCSVHSVVVSATLSQLFDFQL